MRPAVLFGLEAVRLTGSDSQCQMRFSLEVTKMDRIRNKHIRGTAQVVLETKLERPGLDMCRGGTANI